MANLKSWLVRTVAVVALSTQLSAGIAAASPEESARVIELVNEQRAANGLQPLVPNESLANAAEGYAAYMADANFFSHVGANGSRMVGRNENAGYVGWRFMGENLAAGQATPERLVSAWMNSPTHRANVLAPEAVEIGIGHAYTGWSRYQNYWSMEIGARW